MEKNKISSCECRLQQWWNFQVKVSRTCPYNYNSLQWWTCNLGASSSWWCKLASSWCHVVPGDMPLLHDIVFFLVTCYLLMMHFFLMTDTTNPPLLGDEAASSHVTGFLVMNIQENQCFFLLLPSAEFPKTHASWWWISKKTQNPRFLVMNVQENWHPLLCLFLVTTIQENPWPQTCHGFGELGLLNT